MNSTTAQQTKMDEENAKRFVDFKTLTANLQVLEIIKTQPSARLLGHLKDDGTFIAPTKITHHKFSVALRSQPQEMMVMYVTALMYLKEVCNMPPALFEGNSDIIKHGYIAYDNEYQTSIRIWNTKKIGKRIVYEVSIATFK